MVDGPKISLPKIELHFAPYNYSLSFYTFIIRHCCWGFGELPKLGLSQTSRLLLRQNVGDMPLKARLPADLER